LSFLLFWRFAENKGDLSFDKGEKEGEGASKAKYCAI
jgi:hypothetical protein